MSTTNVSSLLPADRCSVRAQSSRPHPGSPTSSVLVGAAAIGDGTFNVQDVAALFAAGLVGGLVFQWIGFPAGAMCGAMADCRATGFTWA